MRQKNRLKRERLERSREEIIGPEREERNMKPSLILQHRSSSLSPNKVPSLDKNPNLHNHFYPSLGIVLIIILF